jgi:hypothetical protein
VSEQAAAPAVKKSRARSIGLYVLLVIAGLLLLVTSFAIWVNRVALNTNQFADTSTQLIDDPEIRSAVAQRAVDELYANVDVEAAIKERLPKDVQQLAGPTAAALRQAAPTVVDRALEQPALQNLWSQAIEQSHKTLVKVLEGNGNIVETQGGVVVLDLRQIVLETADRLGIRSQVEARLPADAGRIVILRSNELDTAQNVFQLLKTLAWVLPILTLLAFAGAVWLAPDRRRAIIGVGVTVAVVGILGLLAARLTGNYVVNSLVEEHDARPAANNAWNILTDLMRSSFRWLVVFGILFVIAAWLAGPGRRAIASRHALAPALQQRTWAYIVLAAAVLIFLVTRPTLDFAALLVLIVLACLGVLWIELMRSQTAKEFPDAAAPALLDGARTKVEGWRESRRTTPGAKPAGTTSDDISARLANLAELHSSGALTDEEFASAKARLLANE